VLDGNTEIHVTGILSGNVADQMDERCELLRKVIHKKLTSAFRVSEDGTHIRQIQELIAPEVDGVPHGELIECEIELHLETLENGVTFDDYWAAIVPIRVVETDETNPVLTCLKMSKPKSVDNTYNATVQFRENFARDEIMNRPERRGESNTCPNYVYHGCATGLTKKIHGTNSEPSFSSVVWVVCVVSNICEAPKKRFRQWFAQASVCVSLYRS